MRSSGGFLLDTHVWVEAQLGEADKFGAATQRQLEDAQKAGNVYLSAISVLEVARLVASEYRSLPVSIDDFVAEALADHGLQLLDLTPRILIDSTRLPGDMHRDPSDRLIVATARAHGLTLVTRDKALLTYAKQGHLNARKP